MAHPRCRDGSGLRRTPAPVRTALSLHSPMPTPADSRRRLHPPPVASPLASSGGRYYSSTRVYDARSSSLQLPWELSEAPRLGLPQTNLKKRTLGSPDSEKPSAILHSPFSSPIVTVLARPTLPTPPASRPQGLPPTRLGPLVAPQLAPCDSAPPMPNPTLNPARPAQPNPPSQTPDCQCHPGPEPVRKPNPTPPTPPSKPRPLPPTPSASRPSSPPAEPSPTSMPPAYTASLHGQP